MIIFQDISLSLGGKTLFSGINWTIATGSRIGLVGDNGTGKTTLLRSVMGEVELDQGAVIIPEARHKTIGYLPQDLVELEEVSLLYFLKRNCGLLALEETIRASEEQLALLREEDSRRRQIMQTYDRAIAAYNAKDGYAFEARARQILKGLGFREDDFGKNCADFSGGWKMRIYLSVLLLSRPDILLLDEPTNHLDTESMEWLEEYLKDYGGTIITVAHDRFFLDKMVSQIAELAGGRVTLFPGNYSYYLLEKDKRGEILRKEALHQRAQIAHQQAFIERFRYKATKSKQVQSRIKLLSRLPQQEEEVSQRKVAIRFPEHKKSGREVIKVEGLGKSYGDLTVFRDVGFTITRGEKVAFVGVNGAGKSTLTRIIGGQEEPTRGNIAWGLNARMSLFSQESAENLNYRLSVWEEVGRVTTSMNDQEKRNLLGAFLFSGDDINKSVSVLSGGEKSRLALLKIILTDSNILIMDEPTNHLDIKTKDIFQEALLNYQGTIILVSHDRYFLDRLVSRVLEIRDGALYDYPGNYSYFVEKRKELARSGQVDSRSFDQAKTSLAGEKKSLSDKKTAAEEKNRLYQLKSGLKKELAGLEAEIMQREQHKGQNESLLCDPLILKDAARVRQLKRELAGLTDELAGRYAEWDDLIERLEEVQAASAASRG
ncbi:MAG: ABC-F family ATP-binding cassette domain-containing protein [Smithellaceae bacterium]|nr:ABC-F family ATP-binding cassette domain-containing protein [Smithellaceae bacterium]